MCAAWVRKGGETEGGYNKLRLDADVDSSFTLQDSHIALIRFEESQPARPGCHRSAQMLGQL